MRRESEPGFTLLELLIAVGVAAIVVTVSYTTWQRFTAQQRLRHAAMQVASALRQAEERAKAERATYTIAFTASSSSYVIARGGVGSRRPRCFQPV